MSNGQNYVFWIFAFFFEKYHFGKLAVLVQLYRFSCRRLLNFWRSQPPIITGVVRAADDLIGLDRRTILVVSRYNLLMDDIDGSIRPVYFRSTQSSAQIHCVHRSIRPSVRVLSNLRRRHWQFEFEFIELCAELRNKEKRIYIESSYITEKTNIILGYA